MSKEKNMLPQFENEAQEAEYFDEHSPLDIVAEPTLEKVIARGIKDRPITIRLDSETRAKLNRLATRRGLGPSTFARLVLTKTIEYADSPSKVVTLDELISRLENSLSQDKEKFEKFIKDIAIGDPDNPALLVFSGERKTWEDFTSLFLKRLLELLGVQIVIPEKENYQKLKEVAKSQT